MLGMAMNSAKLFFAGASINNHAVLDARRLASGLVGRPRFPVASPCATIAAAAEAFSTAANAHATLSRITAHHALCRCCIIQ